MRQFPNGVWMVGLLLGMVLHGCTDRLAAEEPVAASSDTTASVVITHGTPPLSRLDSLFAHYDPALVHPLAYDSVAAVQWVDSLMATLTLDQKIGQLFMVNLPRPGLRTVLDDDALQAVRNVGVGGFLVPRLLQPRVVFEETQRLQAETRVPLFFAADYERGAGRFNNTLTELPSNMALGATRDTVRAAAAGRLTAIESRALGINLLFAPVVDVNNNPNNPIINIRSYGEDPALVGAMAAAFVREAQAYGVLTTLKHFPGHGNTTTDSHARMGTVAGAFAVLDSIELRPYRDVLTGRHPSAGVMTAHLWVPALDEAPRPATFSRRALTDVLRDSLGFTGFVVTDDIKMGALSNTYTLEERVVRALQAGADLLLTPDDLKAAVQAIKTALAQGRLDEAQIDACVRRLLHAKARAGLYRTVSAEDATLDYLLAESRGVALAEGIAQQAITLLKNDQVLPLDATQQIALVQITNIRTTESLEAAQDLLARLLHAEADLRIDSRTRRGEVNQVPVVADSADVIVIALYQRLQAGRGKAGLHPEQEELVRRLVQGSVPTVLLTLGNPYALAAFPEAEAVLVAYEQALESVTVMAHIMQGNHMPQGHLPISVTPYAFGAGASSLRTAEK